MRDRGRASTSWIAGGLLLSLLIVSALLPPRGSACSGADRETGMTLDPRRRSPWEDRMVFDADVPRAEPRRIEFLPGWVEDWNGCSDDGEECGPDGQNAADALFFSDALEHVLIGPSEDPGEASLHYLIGASSDKAGWYRISDDGLGGNVAVVSLYPWSHDLASWLPDRDEAEPNGRELPATVYVFGLRRPTDSTQDPNYYYGEPYALTPERYEALLGAEP